MQPGKKQAVKLRYAKREDLDFLIEGLEQNRVLENRPKEQIKARPSDKQQFEQAIAKRNIRVAEQNGEPIAFIYFRTDFKILYLHQRIFWVDLIYVKEDQRRRGLGRLLYQDVTDIARKKGFKKVTIDIFDSNRASRKFHRALGFQPIYTIYQKDI
jgi:L-amino acid N-acyltransferase YncA